jgi:hypothetical protein
VNSSSPFKLKEDNVLHTSLSIIARVLGMRRGLARTASAARTSSYMRHAGGERSAL